MGVAISKIWGSGPRYTGDSTTGLTAEEKTILADSFNVLKQDLSKSGERLFILYFGKFPDNKSYFRDFKDKTIEELQGNPKLTAHGTNVMCSLNGIILQLNEPEALVELIKKIGFSHGKRNIKEQAFVDLKEVFVDLLKEKLKNKCTTQVLEVWSKTLDVVVKVFFMGVEEYKNQYFQNYPEHQNYFIDFRNRTIVDLQGCPRLLFHASNVMNTLNSVMMYLNEPETLVDLIKKVGYGHGRRGIKLQAFEDLKSTFVLLLQEKLKSKYNPRIGEVWGKTFQVITATFQSGVQQYIDEQNINKLS